VEARLGNAPPDRPVCVGVGAVGRRIGKSVHKDHLAKSDLRGKAVKPA
jgi:hypothetical protein